MNYTKKKRVVKYKRYISIIKACNLIRSRDKSFLGFNTMIYGFRIMVNKTERSLRHHKLPVIITAMHYDGMEYKTKGNELCEESKV